jgi:hypothetical protein
MLSLAFIRTLLHVSALIVGHHQAYIKNAGTRLLNRNYISSYGAAEWECMFCNSGSNEHQEWPVEWEISPARGH